MNSATIFFALAAIVASAVAVSPVGHGHHDVHAYPQYKFSYGVSDKHTGDQKSASEVRDGGVTKGSYSLVQPDGVLRTVNYIVTPHGGFQAQVVNKGVAGHPAVYGHGGHGAGHLGGYGAGNLGGYGAGNLGGYGGYGAGNLGGLGGYGGLGGHLGGASSFVGGLGAPVAAGHGHGLGAGYLG